MKKKKILTLAMCIAMAAIMAVGTLAYFTDTETTDNVFTVGNVDITLTEPSWDPETVEHVAPGMTYAKDPTVTNVGANDCWVRVNVTVTDWAALQAACANHKITDLTKIFNGFVADDWKLAGKTESGDTATYSYYYKEAIAPEASTSPIFESVTIPGGFTNEEMEALGEDFTITVTADAVQTSEDYETAADAFKAVEGKITNPKVDLPDDE